MTRYVHRATVIDAVLWDDDYARTQLAELGYAADCGPFRYADQPNAEAPRTLLVPTDQGDKVALPGEDYVVRGVSGEWYVIRPDVFHVAYEALPERVGV